MIKSPILKKTTFGPKYPNRRITTTASLTKSKASSIANFSLRIYSSPTIASTPDSKSKSGSNITAIWSSSTIFARSNNKNNKRRQNTPNWSSFPSNLSIPTKDVSVSIASTSKLKLTGYKENRTNTSSKIVRVSVFPGAVLITETNSLKDSASTSRSMAIAYRSFSDILSLF